MTEPRDTSSDKKDWRNTVFLPKTDFPMKAGLPQKEPLILAKWQDMRLYEALRESRVCCIGCCGCAAPSSLI